MNLTENVSSIHYVPGTTASIQGLAGPVGGCDVVSCVPLSPTSVDLAASHPESSFVFPIDADNIPISPWTYSVPSLENDEAIASVK